MITRQQIILSALSFVILFVSAGCTAISQAQRSDDANHIQKISGVSRQGDSEKTATIAQPVEAGNINPDSEPGEQGFTRYAALDGEVGVARYYAKRYNGKKTSSGEIHNPKELTAAHPSIPLGTKVKVISLNSNKSVMVKVNDRCREHKEPFIDLSREAARKLGILRKGKAIVRMIIIGDEDSLSEHTAAEENNE